MSQLKYYLIYKPFQVLCQFSPEAGKQTLKDFFDVEKDVYPVGRLDYDSEGLLILTNDTSLNHRLLNPDFQHEREYWVQVDGDITKEALQKLSIGTEISVNGKKYHTLPAKAAYLPANTFLPERTPPIRFRKSIPAPWISLTLQEGKNRQVRKMTASVGFPTLRLIRYRIEKLTLNEFLPGTMNEISAEEIKKALFFHK